MVVQFAAILRCWHVRFVMMLLIVAVFSSVALAQAPVMRVEEDWELVVATPDPDSDAPQITCVISPHANLDSYYATFEINHQSEQAFDAGGLQLQIWEGETLIGDRGYPNHDILSTEGETVAWTQSLEVRDGVVTFEITEGDSTTWGAFGGQGYLKAMVPTELSSLGGYSPSVSTHDSGVSYASNRVNSLTLKSVRYYDEEGNLISEDNVPKVVHSL